MAFGLILVDAISVEVGLRLLVYVVPCALFCVLFVKRRSWRAELAPWRRRGWWTGFLLGAVASCYAPVFLAGIQFLSDSAKANWFLSAALWCLIFASLLALVSIPLLGFGKGYRRWLGMIAACIVCAELYAVGLWIDY